MASVNKAIIIGNLGRDPEMRYLPNGNPVTNVAIATSQKGKDGTEHTQWHRCVAYEKLAEIIGQYAKKGQPIYVEGSIRYGKFTNKDGVEQHTTDIIINQVQLLGSRQDGDQRQPQHPAQRQAPRQAPQQPAGGFDDMDGDIPFRDPLSYRGTHLAM